MIYSDVGFSQTSLRFYLDQYCTNCEQYFSKNEINLTSFNHFTEEVIKEIVSIKIFKFEYLQSGTVLVLLKEKLMQKIWIELQVKFIQTEKANECELVYLLIFWNSNKNLMTKITIWSVKGIKTKRVSYIEENSVFEKSWRLKVNQTKMSDVKLMLSVSILSEKGSSGTEKLVRVIRENEIMHH